MSTTKSSPGFKVKSFDFQSTTGILPQSKLRRKSSVALDIIHRFNLKEKLEKLENRWTKEKHESKIRRMPFMSPEKRKNLKSAATFKINNFIKKHAVKVDQIVLNKVSLWVTLLGIGRRVD